MFLGCKIIKMYLFSILARQSRTRLRIIQPLWGWELEWQSHSTMRNLVRILRARYKIVCFIITEYQQALIICKKLSPSYRL